MRSFTLTLGVDVKIGAEFEREASSRAFGFRGFEKVAFLAGG